MKRTTYILIGMYFFGMIMMIISIVSLGNVLEKYNEPQHEMTAPAFPETDDDSTTKDF